MTQATASDRVLQLMLTVLHRRATSPAETLHQLVTRLGISTAGEMDQLELTFTNFAPLPAEPLDQFVWRLHLALDEYNSRAPSFQLPKYSDRKLFMQLLRVLPPFLSDIFTGRLAAAQTDFLFYLSTVFLICSTSVCALIKPAERHQFSWGATRLPLLASARHLPAVAHSPSLPRRTCCRLSPAVLRNLAPGDVT